MSVRTPQWRLVLARYATPIRLHTRARRAGFLVATVGEHMIVTPDSTGYPRTITQRQFEESVPLLGRTGRAELQEASRNSSYIEAIVLDLEAGAPKSS